MKKWILAIFLLLASCDQHLPDRDNYLEFAGREARGIPIYRLKKPDGWTAIVPIDREINDTTKPICELLMIDVAGQIRITIHNFPAENQEERIPPQSQLGRWKKQFKEIDHLSEKSAPQSFSGYYGVIFEASGMMKGKEMFMMAWALQMANEHFLAISTLMNAEPENNSLRQLRSDITIKAVGPKNLLEKYRDEIMQIARSFEMIQAIPYL